MVKEIGKYAVMGFLVSVLMVKIARATSKGVTSNGGA